MKRILTISLLLLAVIFTVSADRRRLLGARNVASAPAASFSASYFTNAIATNTLSGLANSQLGLFSMWFYREAGQNTTTMLTVGGASIKFLSPEPGITARDNTGAVICYLYSSVNPPAGWHHLLVSYDLSTAGRRQVYLDGTNTTAVVTFTVPTTAQYVTNWTMIGNEVAAGGYAGSLSQVYFAIPSSYYDISSGGNLAKFWASESGTTGNQVDIGADGSTPLGVQPILYWKGDASSWANLGSGGGSFTTNHYSGYIISTNAP